MRTWDMILMIPSMFGLDRLFGFESLLPKKLEISEAKLELQRKQRSWNYGDDVSAAVVEEFARWSLMKAQEKDNDPVVVFLWNASPCEHPDIKHGYYDPTDTEGAHRNYERCAHLPEGLILAYEVVKGRLLVPFKTPQELREFMKDHPPQVPRPKEEYYDPHPACCGH